MKAVQEALSKAKQKERLRSKFSWGPGDVTLNPKVKREALSLIEQLYFECTTKACIPPASGGTGGSNPGSGGSPGASLKGGYVHVNGKKMGSKVTKMSSGAHKGLYKTTVGGVAYTSKTKGGLPAAVAAGLNKGKGQSTTSADFKGKSAAKPAGSGSKTPAKKTTAESTPSKTKAKGPDKEDVKKAIAADVAKKKAAADAKTAKPKAGDSTDDGGDLKSKINKFDTSKLKGDDKQAWDDNMESLDYFYKDPKKYASQIKNVESELSDWIDEMGGKKPSGKAGAGDDAPAKSGDVVGTKTGKAVYGKDSHEDYIAKFDKKKIVYREDKEIVDDLTENVKWLKTGGTAKEYKDSQKDLAEFLNEIETGKYTEGGGPAVGELTVGRGRNLSDNNIFKQFDTATYGLNGFNDGKPPPKGLPKAKLQDDDTVAALAYYRGDGYRDINKQLRGIEIKGISKREREENDERVEAMDRAFESATPTTQDIVVYRGIGNYNMGEDALKAITDADSFSDDGFTSTSYSEKSSKSFAEEGGAMMKIVIPKGSRVLKMSDENWESEVLLPRGGTYVKQADGSYIFQVK